MILTPANDAFKAMVEKASKAIGSRTAPKYAVALIPTSAGYEARTVRLEDMKVVATVVDADLAQAAMLGINAVPSGKRSAIAAVYRHDAEGTFWEHVNVDARNLPSITERFVHI